MHSDLYVTAGHWSSRYEFTNKALLDEALYLLEVSVGIYKIKDILCQHCDTKRMMYMTLFLPAISTLLVLTRASCRIQECF